MKLQPALLWIVLTVSSLAHAEVHTLSAKSGDFHVHILRPSASSSIQLSGSMLINDYTNEQAWPSAAYMGLFQGQDRNNSIQVLAIRNKPTDQFLMAGYRLIIGGKEAAVASITSVGLHEPIQVKFSFNGGVATVQINHSEPVTVQTPFSEVSPYVSVSSANAEFEIAP